MQTRGYQKMRRRQTPQVLIAPLPLEELPSVAVALDAPDGADALAARLRACDPHVVARVADGQVLLDVLTLSDDDLALLPSLVERAR